MNHLNQSLLVGVLLAALVCSSGAQRKYAVTEMGNFTATAINGRGQVSGFRIAGARTVAVRWENGVIITFPTLSTNSAGATGINNAGQMSGFAFDGSLRSRAVRFGVDTSIITPLNDHGAVGSQGTAINDNGFIAGYVDLSSPSERHVARWMAGDSLEDLGTLTNHGATGRGMNNLGDVVGDGEAPPVGQEHAVVSFNGAPILDLHNISNLGGNRSEAYDINNLRHIVGMARISTGEGHAVMWRNNVIMDLHTLPPGGSAAVSVNDSDQVVGNYGGGAFLWEDGVMKNLNDMIETSSGWILQTAIGINSNGQIIGSGLHNGQTRAYLLNRFFVTEPQPGDLWIAGQQDTIRWTAAGSINSVTISLSTDGGGLFNSIVQNIPANSGKYVWSIPDTTLSRKSVIKISDASNPNVFVHSDLFKIKGYELTRIRPDSNYERFLPGKDGWSFPNTVVGLPLFWPSSWWSQFNYSGVDPNTGDPYPSTFVSLPVAAQNSDFVDWPLFVNAFGRNQCFWFQDVYRNNTINFWGSKSSAWKGSCFGVAVSSLLAFHYKDLFIARHPGVPNFDSLFALFMTNTIRLVIHGYHVTQSGALKLVHDQNNQSTTPRQTLQWIRQMWSNESPDDDASLRYVDPAGSGGHAVVPYKLVRNSVNPVQFRLFVCNSNNPTGLNDFILIDSLANTWEEFTGLGWGAGTLNMYLHPAANQFFLTPIIPSRPQWGGIVEATASETGGVRLRFDSSPRMNILILSQSGDSVGFANGFAFNSIANALPLIPETGQPHPPLGYDIPSGNYRVKLSNFLDSTTYFSASNDSLTLTYSRADAGVGQSDNLSYDGGLNAKNTNVTPKNCYLQALVSEDSSEKTCNIDNFVLSQNDSVSLGTEEGDRVKLVNHGAAVNYDLRLRSASIVGEQLFESENLPLPAQSTHVIAPQWDSLYTTLLQVFVDLGNNGTIDDTLFIGNTLDVDERGTLDIPKEYNLAQNYPNPFNPSTRIEYALPHASHVRLTVYNVLGQLLTTLVDEERPAGRFAAEWNGNNVSSGVYFYRLEARQNGGQLLFASVKKMLLLK